MSAKEVKLPNPLDIEIKISDLGNVQVSVSTLMFCEAIGLDNSLIFHKINKYIKGILDTEFNEPVKLIRALCAEMDGKEPKTDDHGNIIWKEGKKAEYDKKYDELFKKTVTINTEFLNLAELPKNLGTFVPGNPNLPSRAYYEYIPHLFDVIYFSKEDYEERVKLKKS